MKKFLLTLTLCFLSSFSTQAEPISVQTIENYLNNLSTLQADFQQIVPGEDYAYGTFYLARPRQFLWQYTTPKAQKIVSNGGQMFYHNEETNQVTQLPLNSGLAAILTRPNFNLSGEDISVKDYRSTTKGVAIQLGIDGHEDMGNVVLAFTKNPLTLAQIQTQDTFGNQVNVIFNNVEQNIPLNKKLFDFSAPRIGSDH
jgi:outer membrane lipoprotein-sorting protein